jgi:hypothetical protein
MSYRQLCSSAGLGFDWNATKQEGISTVTSTVNQVNADYVNQAVDKMSVPAFAAGPISKAEQDAVGLLIEQGAAGKLPTPAQFANILKTAGVTVVAGAAAAACGPAAPLCGAAAGYVTSSILNTISGSGSGGCAKINGMCDSDYWAAYRKAVLAKCPPGSQACRDRLNDLWFKKIPALFSAERVAYETWQKNCLGKIKVVGGLPKLYAPPDCYQQCPEPRSTLSGSPSDCVKKAMTRWELVQNPNGPPVNAEVFNPPSYGGSTPSDPWSWVSNPSGKTVKGEPTYAVKEETRILLESRYKAEYEYITTVDAQTKALQDKVVPQCRTAGCKSQVKGILGEGAFEAAQLLRSPTGGKALADRAMQQAMLQADGAIQQSRQVSQLQTDANQARFDAAESKDTTRKVILGLAAVAVVATGAAIYLKKRRR